MLFFRRAADADASEISAVYLAAWKEFFTFTKSAHSDENVRKWIADYLISHTETHVALLNNSVIGMMSLTRAETAGWIDQLYIHPRAVGLGIGSQFMERAKTMLGSPIRLYTFQANTGARRFYERHGFTAIAFNDGSNNEEKCPDVLYEWRIK